MRKFKTLLFFLILGWSICGIAQPIPPPPPMQPMERPSVYQQVDEVRKALQLNQSQFEKAYSAYEKYNKAVFEDEAPKGQFQKPPQGGRGPGGRPPGGGVGFGGPGSPGGGMGGPGGMPPGGMDVNPSQFGGNPPSAQDNKKAEKSLTQKEIEKKQKTIAKQEEKLEKTMHKLFKKEPEKYAEWQKIRERQLSATFPGSPDPNRKQ